MELSPTFHSASIVLTYAREEMEKRSRSYKRTSKPTHKETCQYMEVNYSNEGYRECEENGFEHHSHVHTRR